MKVTKDNMLIKEYKIVGFEDNKEYIRIFLNDPPIKEYIPVPMDYVDIIEDINITTIRDIKNIYAVIRIGFNITKLMDSNFKFIDKNREEIEEALKQYSNEELEKIISNAKYTKPVFLLFAVSLKYAMYCVNYNNIRNNKSGIYIDKNIKYPVCIQIHKNEEGFICSSLIFKSYESMINTISNKHRIHII